MGYWKFSKLLNVSCPWILLLPLHNLAYIGLLGNVARREDGLREGLDLSVWYVVMWLMLAIAGLILWKYPGVMALTLVGIFAFLLYVVGIEIHYCLFRLYSRYPGVVSLIWCVPGVVLWQAIVAERRLEESICNAT